MCGRYTHRASDPPRYNIAPGTDCLVTRVADGVPAPGLMRWGFAPHWLRDPGKAQVNARSETVTERRMFRDAFLHARCLVAADGWYEWTPAAGRKQPWFFQMRDATPFAFAGIWTQGTFAILTTAASAFAARFYDRMPVLLREQDWDEWLDDHPQGPGRLQFLCRTWHSAPLVAWPGRTAVHRPAHAAPECVAPGGAAVRA
jgi:putative SOS response-associated peptidase YedK